jgi:EAL and modified HD-GYP domain-containing signal transduction protein
MTVPETSASFFPITALQPVTNARHEWTAIGLRIDTSRSINAAALVRMLAVTDWFEAVGTLPFLMPLTDAVALDPDHFATLPPDQVILCVTRALYADTPARERLQDLQARGFRIMLDWLPQSGEQIGDIECSFGLDCSTGVPLGAADWLHKTAGPHLAQQIANPASFDQCRVAGFGWFSGSYPLHCSSNMPRHDGSSRTRLLKLLALVARDAESRELETLLKQDPALSYQLIKLVNSAAFAHSTQITSFNQAINLLGRRQLQRWLQLLLYSRQQDNGEFSPLLSRAALRASLMEAFCRHRGGSREQQDRAFMTGIFSLLDVLFAMPLADLIKPLNLADDVVAALLEHSGHLGQLLSLTEHATGDGALPASGALIASGIDPNTYWHSVAQACRWAIQVSREA